RLGAPPTITILPKMLHVREPANNRTRANQANRSLQRQALSTAATELCECCTRTGCGLVRSIEKGSSRVSECYEKSRRPSAARRKIRRQRASRDSRPRAATGAGWHELKA